MAKTLDPALTPFYPVPKTVANIPSKELNTTAKLVFAVIAGFSHLKEGKCRLSNKGIGEKIGLSASAVRDTMKALERLNLIIIEPKNGSSNRITPNYKELQRLNNMSNSGATDNSTPTDDSPPVQKDTKPNSVGGADGIPSGGATECRTQVEEEIDNNKNPLTPFKKGEFVFYPFEDDPGYCVDAKESDESTRLQSDYPEDGRKRKNSIWLSYPGFPTFLKKAFPLILFDRLDIRELRKLFEMQHITTEKIAKAVIAKPQLREIRKLPELIEMLCIDSITGRSLLNQHAGMWETDREGIIDDIQEFYETCPQSTVSNIENILEVLRKQTNPEEVKACHRAITSTIGSQQSGYSPDLRMIEALGERIKSRYSSLIPHSSKEPFSFYYCTTQLGLKPSDCNEENRQKFNKAFARVGYIRRILLLYSKEEAEQYFAVNRDVVIDESNSMRDRLDLKARMYQLDIESIVGADAILEAQSICDDVEAETLQSTDLP